MTGDNFKVLNSYALDDPEFIEHRIVHAHALCTFAVQNQMQSFLGQQSFVGGIKAVNMSVNYLFNHPDPNLRKKWRKSITSEAHQIAVKKKCWQ